MKQESRELMEALLDRGAERIELANAAFRQK